MIVTKDPSEFLRESLQVIQSHPTTTITTTTYASTSTLPSAPHPHPTTDKVTKRKPKRRIPTLKIKTYEPTTGIVVVFKTDKIADVGRIVGALSRAARRMGGLPDVEPQEEEVVAPAVPVKVDAPTPSAATPAPAAASGKSKKKRGKK